MASEVAPAWIAALPKAEVHLHLEGCLEPGLVATAARRHPGPHPAWGAGSSAEAPRITSLARLMSYLDWSCALIDRTDDLAATAYGAARRATASGVGHIDVIVNPTHWPHFRGRLGALVDALDDGFRAAQDDGYATAALCISLKRTQTRTEATALVDWMLERRHPRVAALSIDGDETGGSHNERFAEAFRRAGRGGLRLCAHAGESSGPDGVRQAVEVLGAERVDHGVRAVEDPALVADLVRRSLPLDVCPTSNIVLGIVPDLAAHPVERLRSQGVRVSLNTDDPLLYGVDVTGEYAMCAAAFGWTRPQVADIARTSIESCFADEDRRQRLLTDLGAYTAGDH
jgi:adenosine deaminase